MQKHSTSIVGHQVKSFLEKSCIFQKKSNRKERKEKEITKKRTSLSKYPLFCSGTRD